ncbi:MAG: AAA family ATPase [Myxococcales bacterium]|nr:AAA family ATPase [Myxococcales bacterium]
MSWRERFGMEALPLPRGAAGESFFDGDPHYQRLARAFAWLAAEPGIGVVTGEPGVGKTAALRHLCRSLPASEHRVVYLCDCAVKPLDLYRMLAAELGLRPGPRAQIVSDIKAALVSLVDERGVVPIVILDEAQGLRDELLHELYGLCSLDLDGRDYLTLWLVGHPRLARRLRLQQHTALAQRVLVHAPLVAITDPALLDAMLDHGLAAAGAPADLVTAEARQLLHRACRGLPRLASQLLRLAILLADEQGLPSLDGPVMSSAIALLHLETLSPPRLDLPKPRFERGSKPRK